MPGGGASPASYRQLIRRSKTEEITVAVLGEAERRRTFGGRACGRVPAENRRQVVALFAAGDTSGRAEAAVRFRANHEVFSAEGTRRPARESADGARHADAVPELDAFAGRQVPLHDEILGDVPGSNHTRQNQFAFQFVGTLGLQLGDRSGWKGTRSYDFLLNATGFADVLVFDIEHGVEAVLPFEWPEPAFKAPSSKAVALASSGDALEVQLGRPPPGEPVLELDPRRGVYRMTVLRSTSCGRNGDFEIAWFLQIMIVGDEIRSLLASRTIGRRTAEEQREDANPERRHTTPFATVYSRRNPEGRDATVRTCWSTAKRRDRAGANLLRAKFTPAGW